MFLLIFDIVLLCMLSFDFRVVFVLLLRRINKWWWW